MSRTVQVVILCEDRQHEAFARRFLALAGMGARVQRVRIAPKGRGSGEQFVREKFVEEMAFYRDRQHRVGQALIVIIDADGHDAAARVEHLKKVCVDAGLPPRQPEERVAIFVPARNIETWLAYLEGNAVNELDTYPRLENQRECQRHVESLWAMCQRREIREPAPPSLVEACLEYRARLDPGS